MASQELVSPASGARLLKYPEWEEMPWTDADRRLSGATVVERQSVGTWLMVYSQGVVSNTPTGGRK